MCTIIENIKFCILLTLSKILAASVALFTILSIPMVLVMLYFGEERVGISYLYFFLQLGFSMALLPFCAKFAKCFFKEALVIASKEKICGTKEEGIKEKDSASNHQG